MDAVVECFSEICDMMYVYILTNHTRNVFYVGVTNNLKRRLQEHLAERGKFKTFAGRYYCYKLVYFETYDQPIVAIRREKELKKLLRREKIALIKTKNPHMHFYRM